MNWFKRAALASTLMSAISMSAFAQEISTDRYIIKYNDGGRDVIAAEIERINGELLLSIDSQNLLAAKLSTNGVTRLNNFTEVDFIELDPKRHFMAETIPYGIPMVEAPLVSESFLTPRKVCIIDTGYDLGHADLPSLGVTGDSVYYSNGTLAGNWYDDPLGHGTKIAGVIAALGGNNIGVTSTNPGGILNLHIVRIFSDQGIFFGSDSIAALDKCTLAGADIVNMSYGGPVSSQLENQALIAAGQAGVLMISASGNDGAQIANYPATYDAVMSVGNVDSMGVVATNSTYHPAVEISAPGVGVMSTFPNDQYGVATPPGTSISAAHVTGVAAKVWGHYPMCTGQQIRLALGNTAEDKGPVGKDKYYGNGIVKAKAAFDALATNGCTVPPQAPQLQNGVTVPSLIAAAGSQLDFTMNVTSSANMNAAQVVANNMPTSTSKSINAASGISDLKFVLSGGTGNADLYVRYGAKPTLSTYDCLSQGAVSDEICEIPNPQSGKYYVMVQGESLFYGVSLTGSYTDAIPTFPIDLSVTTRRRKKRNVSTLIWSGATTRRVDFYVNGMFYKRTRNDGKIRHRTRRGSATYNYQICNKNSTTHCSDIVSVTY